ncbi:hypothetical protein WMY93_006247 [Mugilogobius chulae]|uniref:Uncharacterized protein n=1 Tax=Mugilogobius chulae TaxID=88201 RepID=A0AAW0PSY4_9GOBI
MPLSAYMSPHSQDALEDLGDALSDLEKKLCQHFRRLEIAGKRGRKVPVLLTPAMQEALDLLVSKREMCGVVPGNKYLFARPKACSYFRGSDCLRHFAKMCGAKNPESLTSTKLRKQTATLSQVLNLSNTELDQLADFLGHDVRVHRQFYRLPEGTLQLAKVSKILMALEQGRMAEFKGKGLDDITIDPEDHALQDSEDEDENQNLEEDLDAEMPDETNETSQPVTIETSSHPSLQAVQRPSRKGPSRTPTSARRTVITALLKYWSGLRSRCSPGLVLVEFCSDEDEDEDAGTHPGAMVCIFEHESKLNTSAIRTHEDGSSDYGIFAFNSKYWCDDGKTETENYCGTDCSVFLDDKIGDDFACFYKVMETPRGARAWKAWRCDCQGKDVTKYTEGC